MVKSFTGADFRQALTEGSLSEPITREGLARLDETDTNAILFSEGTSSTHWIKIPVAMIDTVDYIKSVRCQDHEHPLVRLSPKDPPAQNRQATAFAELLRRTPSPQSRTSHHGGVCHCGWSHDPQRIGTTDYGSGLPAVFSNPPPLVRPSMRTVHQTRRWPHTVGPGRPSPPLIGPTYSPMANPDAWVSSVETDTAPDEPIAILVPLTGIPIYAGWFNYDRTEFKVQQITLPGPDLGGFVLTFLRDGSNAPAVSLRPGESTRPEPIFGTATPAPPVTLRAILQSDMPGSAPLTVIVTVTFVRL